MKSAALFKLFLVLISCWLVCETGRAALLQDININNGIQQAKVEFNFIDKPVYSWFMLQNPQRLVLDLQKSVVVKGLPLKFSGKNILRQIRTSQPPNQQSIRVVFDLNQSAKGQVVVVKNGTCWSLKASINGSGAPLTQNTPPKPLSSRDPFRQQQPEKVISSNTTSYPGGKVVRNPVITVAIDAGHGGQDPGAIGQKGLKEKNVTIAIARKLQALLNADPMFHAVMTRKGNYFISVMGRSEVARKENANLLVSIHADSAPNHTARGASVWVLSNRRANSEMANWLEQKEKQSELLGGAGDLLANAQMDPYLSQAVLDLQFGHSQRVGYDVALKVLQQLRNVTTLHKTLPEHASLGVLRSPDIPSLLVETGFISNALEEKLLGSNVHQNKIAKAIYQGLRNYFINHAYQVVAPMSKPIRSRPKNVVTNRQNSVRKHSVVKGDTLTKIARRYGVSPAAIMKQNSMTSSNVMLGQVLVIK